MNRGTINVIAVVCASLLAAAPTVQADQTDSLLTLVGQFQLDNGETKTVMRGGAIKAYRVCMEEGRGAVPLKVMYEGRESVVEPGECQLIEAAKIKLATASRLPEGMTLIGGFDSRSGKRYRTDVSLARTARND